MVTLYQEVRAALREFDFRPRKRLGQNFLTHQRVLDSIVGLLDLSEQEQIVEIGPGLGFLSRRLIDVASDVWGVEVDSALVEWLRRSDLGSHPAFHLIHGDILKIRFDDFLPQHKIKLVANLPYSISTAVLFRLFDQREHFSSMVLMVQKEVADRIVSGPGTKAYGTLSVWCQVHGRVTDKILVSPEAFFPRPKVHSTLLKIELYPEPRIAVEDLPFLRGVVRSAFGQRRKTLANTLVAWLNRERAEIEPFLRSCEINPQRRGETLSVDDFIRLSRALKQAGLLKPES
jgi:16S rRNA (adenine1518-N6/adenine1519-N6)-dimethyltransferase